KDDSGRQATVQAVVVLIDQDILRRGEDAMLTDQGRKPSANRVPRRAIHRHRPPPLPCLSVVQSQVLARARLRRQPPTTPRSPPHDKGSAVQPNVLSGGERDRSADTRQVRDALQVGTN